MGLDKGLEYLGGQMEENMKGIGRVENSMDKKYFLIVIECEQTVSGFKE